MARIAGGTDTGLIGDEWIQQEPPKNSYLQNIELGGLWPDEGFALNAGGSGYGSHYRHSGNVALLKNIISNKIATDTGYSLIDKPTRAIGDVLGGITGWGAGLKHEITGPTSIFNKNLTNGIFTTDFLEDMAANYYGAIHGKTGITNTEVVNDMAKALATGENFDLDYLNKLGLRKHLERIRKLSRLSKTAVHPSWGMARTWPMNQTEFRKIFMNKYYKSPSEINRERLEKEQVQKDIKRLKAQTPINWEKQVRGMPEHLSFDTGASNVPTSKKTAPISIPVPARPHGNGGGQRGSMPTGTAGRNPWGRAHGGLIDKPLPGRSRDI